jgi:hypothetical protein
MFLRATSRPPSYFFHPLRGIFSPMDSRNLSNLMLLMSAREERRAKSGVVSNRFRFLFFSHATRHKVRGLRCGGMWW